ncbi:MAG TPA: ATP-binding protein [Leucothrix mucor]|nr:ATP-binding protein [Leucothrix mucor]
MKFSHLEFKDVKGVGSIEVDFTPDKRVHVFIGENGVGKTKFLEALFQVYFYTNIQVEEIFAFSSAFDLNDFKESTKSNLVFSTLLVDKYSSPIQLLREPYETVKKFDFFPDGEFFKPHNYPIIFVSAKNRSFVQNTTEKEIKGLANFSERRRRHIELLLLGMENEFSMLNMNVDIEQWFISIAQSSNPFQKQEDNREIEIRTVLKLFNQIDKSIDSNFMEIRGDNRVFLKINDQKIKLSHLSTGYSSILKIIQSIISGYGYFTNEQQLQHVRGVVFIDEIESHLHLSWQSKIIPTLKELFPNTTFYITTHSPVVLIQLEEGEAYRLQREEDGVVRSSIVRQPSNISFIDLQKQAFDLDLNKIKREQMSADGQKEANQALLDLLNEEAS